MMKVGLVNQVNFKAGEGVNLAGNPIENKNTAQTAIKNDNPDSFDKNAEIAENAAREVKQSTTLKEKTANIWKFMSAANQMANSALRGLLYGALTGTALLSGSWLFRALPKAFTKEGPTLWNTIRHPLKNIGKSGKVIAGIGAGAVLAYQLVAGKLAANQKTAVIDHKMRTGHRDK